MRIINKGFRNSVAVLLAVALCLPLFGCGSANIDCDFNRDGKVDFFERIFCTPLQAVIEQPSGAGEAPIVASGGTLVTYIESPPLGEIAVLVRTPLIQRYPEGAPVVIHVPPFYTPVTGFHQGFDTTRLGAIYVSFLWPGKDDIRTGTRSQGENDYGGPNCLAALRDVIRFALGLINDVNGYSMDQLFETKALTNNVGVFAFSHAGIAATNVLAQHGAEMPGIRYFVGHENPTIDAISSFDLGYYDDNRKPVLNPYYNPGGYSSKSVDIDYSKVGWKRDEQYPQGRPYIGTLVGAHYVLPDNVPQMWGKRYYSIALTQALLDSGALTSGNWPRDMATPEETRKNWPMRTTMDAYPLLRSSTPQLKVMLVFADEDHLQPQADKPHIHQAYDGFREAAGLWLRLNPDLAYVSNVVARFVRGSVDLSDFSELPANVELSNWTNASDWGYPYLPRPIALLVPLTAVAEMADRVQAGNWRPNLNDVLFQTPR